MNISKESCPDDYSIQQNCVPANIHVLGCSSTSSSSSDHGNDQKPDDNQLSHERGLAKLKNSIFKQKAHSYQDLHTDYTKKRYQHVKSKVKDYIASMKASDRPKNKHILRHRSLPETIGCLDECEIIDGAGAETNIHSNEIVQTLLEEKDKEMEELRRLNQHLEDNLQEKLTMLARVKLNADIMRIELLEMKDKQKRTAYSQHRGSLPMNILPFRVAESKSTQTEFERKTNNLQRINCYTQDKEDVVHTDHFSAESDNPYNRDGCQLRHRSLSNSMHCNATTCKQEVSSNSSNDDRCYEECFEMELKNEQVDREEHQLNGGSFNRYKVRRKLTWRRLTGPCKRVVLCCSYNPDVDNEFFYTKLPVDEVPMSSSV